MTTESVVTAYSDAFARRDVDFSVEVHSTVVQDDRAAVHWGGTATMTGPLWGLYPTGARVHLDGIVAGDKLVRAVAVPDSMSVARQIGLLPAAGSATEQRLFGAFNARTRAARRAAAKSKLAALEQAVAR
jgi:hypothetical protein